MTRIYRITASLFIVIALLLSHGCGTRVTRPDLGAAPSVTEESAREAEAAGEFLVASHIYAELAAGASGISQNDFSLRVVENLIKAGQYPEARTKLRSLKLERGYDAGTARKLILLALISSYDGEHEKAARLLNRAEKIRNLEPRLYAEIYRVLAATEMNLNNPVGAAQFLVTREKYISEPAEVDANQFRIWEILSAFSVNDLKRALNLARDPQLAEWVELAMAYVSQPARFGRTASDWKKKHPRHNISESFLKTIAGAKPRHVGRISRIAVLLPLSSSRYAVAAQAVRTGIEMMDKNNNSPNKPVVRFLDYGENPKDVLQFYQLAVDQGAQLVIGPLGREAVDLLADSSVLKVPTILLGHTEINTEGADTPVFQFGLSPEQEAVQAAERAYLDGHRNAGIVYPNNEWGQRMAQAFLEQWQRLGGVALASTAYALDEHDYSDPIKQLLNISNSERREQLLEQTAGINVKFEPRRRQDIDCIFLAATAKHGRLIKPQLNYHRASRLPVYSTSHIYNGRRNRIQDADLNGIYFGDMPWMLMESGSIYDLRMLQGGWSYAYSQVDRLYALGMDAYAVIPHLNRISSEEGIRFNGVTSGISVDRLGRLHRHLLWARFSRGEPRLIDKIYNYSGHQSAWGNSDNARPSGSR